jgi:hypothetical protein
LELRSRRQHPRLLMRSSSCGTRQEIDVGAEADSSDGVWLGNELEEEEDTAYTWARRGSDTERRRRARRASSG